jgi:spore photoproduct lyase
VNLRYRTPWKRTWLARFEDLLGRTLPYCSVRYAF